MKDQNSKRIKIQKIFNPKTVAMIGATDRSGSVGRGLVKNLLEGKKKRKIYLVNPFRKTVFGYKTYPSINSIDQKIDLAIIAVPAKIVPEVTKDCAKKEVGGVIIISAGFAETGIEGKKLQEEIVKTLKEKNIPLVGPNSLGIIRPKVLLNASFAPATPKAGSIAFLSQSGALIDSAIDQSLLEFYGFSVIVSYGNEAGLELSDYLEWAYGDNQTKVIALYIEGLKNGRKFFETAKKITKTKPIVALKGGKSQIAKKVVSSHTGALAGSDEIYSAVFKQAGVIAVESLEELFDVSKALSWQPKCKNGIGIITNGGGAGVLAADYCQQFGLKLTKLSQKTKRKIEMSHKMHPGWSKSNPVDIVGDALPERYKVAINALLEQKDVYGLIVIQTLQVMTEPFKNAKIIIEAKKKWPKKPIITVFMGGKLIQKAVNLLEKNKIPNYPDPKRAVRAMKALVSG
jgi:acetyltransferase